MFSKLHSQNPNLILFLSDEGGFLYSASMQSVQMLNHCSALIWLLIEDGASDEAIQSNDNFAHIQQESLNQTLKKLRSVFETATWEAESIDNNIDLWLQNTGLMVKQGDAKNVLNVDGVCFDINLPEVLQHISILESYDVKSADRYIEIKVKCVDDKFSLLVNGHQWLHPLAKQELVPQLIMLLRRALKLSSNTWSAIHSGIADISDKRVIFPGASGVGKSTLLAALMSNGEKIYSDEQVLMSSQGITTAMSLVVGVKEGSWPIIPQAKNLNVYSRFDGKVVKFLTAFGNCETKAIDLIVFPQYKKDEAQLESMNSFSAVQQLFLSGFEFCQSYSLESFEALLRIIESTPCYRLIYDDLNDACEAIRTLCNDKLTPKGVC